MIRLLTIMLSLPLLAQSAEIWAYLMQGEESSFPLSPALPTSRTLAHPSKQMAPLRTDSHPTYTPHCTDSCSKTSAITAPWNPTSTTITYTRTSLPRTDHSGDRAT